MAENCWVMTHPDGSHISNGEYVGHFASEADAHKRIAEDQAISDPSLRYYTNATPRQLDRPCVIVECGCRHCTEVFDEAGDGYTVHFDDEAAAATVTKADWTKHSDGTFRCIACSPGGDCDCLEESPIPAAQQAGEASQ